MKISSKSSYEHATSSRCVIGIHGVWYDVTEFIPEHPGGDLLWKFNGMDATEVFVSFHPAGGVLKLVSDRKVGSYTREVDPVKADYMKMARSFVKAGYLSVDPMWVVWSLLRIIALGAATYGLALWAQQYILGGLALAFFWQQCGGYLHDCMHSNMTYNMTVDGWLGWLFGTVATGINSDWWKREHDLHHALVNAYTTAPETQSSFARDYTELCAPDPLDLVHPSNAAPMPAPPGPSVAADAACPVAEASQRHTADETRSSSPSSTEPTRLGPRVQSYNQLSSMLPRPKVQAYAVDIQMKEDIWAQSLDVVPLFPSDSPFRWILKLQPYYFLPSVFLLGRVAILLNAWKHERSARQWIGLALHLAATALFCSYLPDWPSVAKFYIAAAIGEGVLHVQLIVNHYLSNWELDENVCHDFVRWTCEATHNVSSPRWLDWFHVGLHLHVEHHLLPKVSRCHFRTIQPIVQEFCAKHNLPYREVPFLAAPWLMLQSFIEAAASVDADPNAVPVGPMKED